MGRISGELNARNGLSSAVRCRNAPQIIKIYIMADLKNLFGNTVYCDFFNLAIAKVGGPIEEFNLSVRTKAGAYAGIRLTEDDILAFRKILEPKIIKEKENAIEIINRVYSKL